MGIKGDRSSPDVALIANLFVSKLELIGGILSKKKCCFALEIDIATSSISP
jgi:hypothetical protein